MYQKIFLTIISAFLFFSLIAQSDEDTRTLFTIDDKPVSVEEFKYIYNKTNGEKADYSKASLEDYLDLYVNFKLKVQRAKDMKLDTLPQLIKELAGYRKTLANSYLVDNQVTEKLIKEAYERSKTDRSVSHIMIVLPQNPSPSDTLVAYNKAKALEKILKNGAKFGELARMRSEDPSAKDNDGNIGYISALTLNGFYPIETAAYNLKVGEYSSPVRTSIGYHLVKVNDERPARGEIDASHILVRITKEQPEKVALEKIKVIQGRLKAGSDFAKVARGVSEDENTKGRGGRLPRFGINTYEKSFEDAAFALKNDGDYSEPVKSSLGWHIIARNTKRELDTYEIERSRLKVKVKRNERFEIAKTTMINRLKVANNYKENNYVLNRFYNSLDKSFYTPKWKVPTTDLKKEVVTFGDRKITLEEYTAHLVRNQPARVRKNRTLKNHKLVAQEILNEYVADEVLKYEEKQLEKKYPEFKALMREYQEGILLFDVTKRLVWDKASKDTIGLQQFYAANAGNYKWKERAELTKYTINTTDKKIISSVQKCAKKKGSDYVLNKMKKKKQTITVEKNTFEKGKNKALDALEWKVGQMTEPKTVGKKTTFSKIENIIPVTNKTLKQAKGYIVADYQDALEQEWLKELKESYKVKVNTAVFKSLEK